MDEPTSAMDMEGEKDLLERLRPEIKGRLVVIATHRPGPLELTDRLIVLDAGHVIADGPRDMVLKSIREGRISRASASNAVNHEVVT
jgi:ATP-binding cassette subfamily C protein LapB